jgi:predicted nucleotidyltransferase
MSDTYAGCLDELRDLRLLPDAYRAVYVAGSVVRGWGNDRSDLDLYVICDVLPSGFAGSGASAVALEPNTVPNRAKYVGDRRWEIEYWLDHQVDQMLQKISWQEFDRNQSAGDLLTLPELMFLERLRHAVAVAGDDWLTAHREMLDRSAVRSILVTRYLGRADSYIEDVVGQLAAGDVYSAVLSARAGFGFAIDALLANYGEYNQRPKWRARCLRGVDQDVISFDRYWTIDTMRQYDPDNPSIWINEVVSVCREIALKARI